MKTPQRLLCCALAVMLSSTGWARMGETLRDCIDRYGEVRPLYLDITLLAYPQSNGRDIKEVTHTRDGFVQYGFEKAGIVCAAAFYDGKASFMAFWKPSPDDPRSPRTPSLSRTEIEVILDANLGKDRMLSYEGGGFTVYKNAGGDVVASYDRWRKFLEIRTSAFESIRGKIQKEKEVKSLEGF